MSHTHTIQENLKRISLTILTQELVQLQADTSTTSFLKCESAFVCFFFSTHNGGSPRGVHGTCGVLSTAHLSTRDSILFSARTCRDDISLYPVVDLVVA